MRLRDSAETLLGQGVGLEPRDTLSTPEYKPTQLTKKSPRTQNTAPICEPVLAQRVPIWCKKVGFRGSNH